jgi:hypothetical protein
MDMPTTIERDRGVEFTPPGRRLLADGLIIGLSLAFDGS